VTRFYSEALGKHDRTAFISGNDRIDSYFKNVVSQDVKRRYAGCYVLIERETSRLAGFYTVSATQFPLADVPADMARKLPRYPSVPAILIGWLGRDIRFRGQEVGGLLLRDAIVRLEATGFGAYALCADAIDEAAAAFYRRFQFTSFESRPMSLFLPLATALKAIER
jgi:ribosomal protein S18 acetylase RimI-like enzyme